MWWKIVLVVFAVLILSIVAAAALGHFLWNADTRKLQARMRAARVPVSPLSYDPRELETLPPPVQRYFRTVLTKGQPLVVSVKVKHTGTFNMSEDGERWTPFSSTQWVTTRRPGFVWDARIHMGFGINIHVHDAYVAGEGVLTAKLSGLFTVMRQPGTPELAHGEMMRFLAEATWYPTALLPSQGVVWDPVDDTHAYATLTDGDTTVKLLFQFDDQGLIHTVRADDRHREVNGKMTATPWQGRFENYTRQNGMLVPMVGEVEWLPPDGPKPYWRGTIQKIEYEMTK